LRPGDECEVVVGAAVYAATILAAPQKAGAEVQVRLGRLLDGPEAGARYSFAVGLVLALSRPAALDWSIEKSTEAGASFILAVQTAGSPRGSSRDSAERLSRWARIAREAAKQSKQPEIPWVEAADSPTAARERVRSLGVVSILLDPGADRSLFDLLRAGWDAPEMQGEEAEGLRPDAGRHGVALWIGPEGGWTDEEREGLTRAGMAAARLGRAVLRTETAGPVAVAVARLALGDW
jgi:16S rRNA (uracil1498-N3)-methyltransferase